MISATDVVTAAAPLSSAALAAASVTQPRLTADELVAVAIDCIVHGREFPDALRAPSAISPGLASVEARIAKLMNGEG